MDEYRAAFPEAKLMIGAGDAPLLSDIEGNVSYLFGDSRVFSKADEKLCDGVHIMAIGAEHNVPIILQKAGI